MQHQPGLIECHAATNSGQPLVEIRSIICLGTELFAELAWVSTRWWWHGKDGLDVNVLLISCEPYPNKTVTTPENRDHKLRG